MRRFYLAYSSSAISETVSRNSDTQTQAPSLPTFAASMQDRFPLPWSHYVRLMAVENPEARKYYEEEALRGGWSVRQLEEFLLELGNDFAFIGRQRRLRIGDTWFRVDLLLFHRRLRSLVVVDLKLGELTHADAGQMHMYLNYAREHWTHPEENPPVGLILCAAKNAMVAKYALEGLPNTVMAAEDQTVLPDDATLLAELERTRKILEDRQET